ncbi:MAG: transglutaminase domain-containing protein [Pseudomonadota bacterium]
MRAAAIVIALAVGCGACSTTAPEQRTPLQYDPALLSGAALFGRPIPPSRAPAHDILGADAAMHAFVGDIVDKRLAVVRFNRLLDKLADSDFFTNTYDANVTLTASETFHRKIGNCMSYSNLFVALARLAGLEVRFQIVPQLYPTWNAEDGVLIRNNHINLSVRGQRFDRNRANGYTIDFNLVEPDPDSQVQPISDAYAASLFYANLSVTALMEADVELSFAYLKRAFAAEPRNPDLWINLGALYNRFGEHRLAIDSLLVAQQIAPRDRTIVSALERSYRVVGEIEVADRLAVKVRRHRNANPYYHFAMAQQAAQRGDHDASKAAIEAALRLKKDEPRFHHLQSLLYRRTGETKLADASLRRARKQGWRG